MAKKKSITPPDIMIEYMKFVLDNEAQPKSIYSFSSDIGIKESEFYDQYGSFKAIEKQVFVTFFDNTKALLEKDKGFQAFDAQNKLLSFYFTFFEILKANRSFVVFALENEKNKLKALAKLSGLKTAFSQFVKELDIDTMDFPMEKMEKFKEQGMTEWSWGQLLFTMKFWIEDDSAGFEKTDILIEKSINTSFALMDNSVLKSVFDLGKFLYKEKMTMS